MSIAGVPRGTGVPARRRRRSWGPRYAIPMAAVATDSPTAGSEALPYYCGTRTRRDRPDWQEPDGREAQRCWVSGTAERFQQTYDIFEGTEQIQQLVIARAISGLRIE